jgi:hypothetical protein
MWAVFHEQLANDLNYKRKMTHTGGWGGIRTLETLARLPVFKTGAFNHSATHPSQQFQMVSPVILSNKS